MAKLVYVMVSDSEDYFCEMAILSVSCARRFSPSLDICLVVDKKTYSELYGYRKEILGLVDEVVVYDKLGSSNNFTSRMIKTNLRNLVGGDYLYIDIDAIPIDDLSSVFSMDCDMAMAFDLNVSPENFILKDYEKEVFDFMSWPYPKKYYNSGVMLVKDNSRVYDFFNTWSAKWKESSGSGLHKDQPAMHEAIRLTNDIKINELDPSYNILLSTQKGIGCRNPKVYHINTIRFEERDETVFHALIKNMKANSYIDWGVIDGLVETKFPWTNESSIRLNLASGRYFRALLCLFKKVAKLS